eukprot:15453116-Alexandrium_andersonii.AAC.1
MDQRYVPGLRCPLWGLPFRGDRADPGAALRRQPVGPLRLPPLRGLFHVRPARQAGGAQDQP